MKKTYEKPALVKVGGLSLVTAALVEKNGHDNGHGFISLIGAA
jgi:hypothetical protein